MYQNVHDYFQATMENMLVRFFIMVLILKGWVYGEISQKQYIIFKSLQLKSGNNDLNYYIIIIIIIVMKVSYYQISI